MDIKDLYPAVLALVMISILIAVGLTVMGNMSDQVRTDATTTDDTFTASNASCVAVGTYITTSTATFENNSGKEDTFSPGYFTWDRTGRYAGSCVTLNAAGVAAGLNGTSVNTTYTHGASTTAQTSIDAGVTAVSGFTTWFAIIVIIIAAAIIIGIVIKSFRP